MLYRGKSHHILSFSEENPFPSMRQIYFIVKPIPLFMIASTEITVFTTTKYWDDILTELFTIVIIKTLSHLTYFLIITNT